jgi:hypothetical protein
MHVDSKGKKHMKGKNKEAKGRKRLDEIKKVKRSSQIEEKERISIFMTTLQIYSIDL